jgi:hypothetical protein
MKKLIGILLLLISTVALFSCSKELTTPSAGSNELPATNAGVIIDPNGGKDLNHNYGLDPIRPKQSKPPIHHDANIVGGSTAPVGEFPWQVGR